MRRSCDLLCFHLFLFFPLFHSHCLRMAKCFLSSLKFVKHTKRNWIMRVHVSHILRRMWERENRVYTANRCAIRYKYLYTSKYLVNGSLNRIFEQKIPFNTIWWWICTDALLPNIQSEKKTPANPWIYWIQPDGPD